MATIVEKALDDGSKAYLVKVRLKGFPPTTRQFSGRGAKAAAKQWATTTEAAMREGRVKPSIARVGIAEAIQRYALDVLARKRSSRTPAQQLAWWGASLPICGADYLDEVTPAIVARCRDALLTETLKSGEKRSGATVNRYLAVLSHLFTVAIKEWQAVERNPVQMISKPKEAKGRVRFLSDDERARLLDEAARRTPALRVVILLGLCTGARRGNLMDLRWEDVDLQRGVLRFPMTKNGEGHTVPLVEPALSALEEWGKVRRIDTPLVFPSPSDPKRPIDLVSVFTRTVKAAAIEDFHFHDLRHSTASYLIQAGVPLATIAAVLGHRTLQMVLRYAHLTDTETRAALEKITSRLA